MKKFMKGVYVYNELWEKDFIAREIHGIEFSFAEGPLHEHPEIQDQDAELLCVFVNSKVGQAELDRFPKLKMIATRSTGFDHVDMPLMRERGITVVNVPTYGEHTVAEFAMALLLALSRRIYDSYKRIETSGSFSQDGLRGFDLKGKTLGVVGTGHIGLHMIKMAKGFDLDILAYDPFPKQGQDQALGFQYVSLEELLRRSDIISFHAPYNEHTHHLLNKGNIQTLKKGVFVINTARGGLIQTDALVEGLESGVVAGAGLDVLEEEGHMGEEIELLALRHPNEERVRTLLANHYFIRHPRVIVTPHVAFNTQEAIERILKTTCENINAYISGQVRNQVQ
jgi:D-lactate dehydrogenase